MKGILTDDSGNLAISGHHLQIGDNRAQCAQHLIGAFTGEYKHAPMLGGNIKRMIAGMPDPFWIGNMKSQLKAALIEVERLQIIDGNIELEIKD